ncbi:MAG TPA: hypothetical protein VH134_14995, partial [Candidatus Dormibacteraeota bacterium]|nr:hypothetical protein [Candidatus Dormibacteraeota bacterium]
MTKRLTPATTTAIGVITVTLLAAGGSRLLVPTTVSAATAGTISLAPATLPPDGKSLAVATVINSGCAGVLLGLLGGQATLQSDGNSLFSTSQSGPFTPAVTVS